MKRLEWVDSLRGIAAFMVLIMHLWEKIITYFPWFDFPGKLFLGFLIEDYLNFGKAGIVIFFMVSGFVIPFSLENKSIRSFFVTRFFRLYPAYWFSIVVFLLILKMPSIILLLANITMFQKFLGLKDLNGVYWTLQIELIFYFICIVFYKYNLLKNWQFIIKFIYFIFFVALVMSFFRYYLNYKLPVALPVAISVMFIGLIIRRKFIEGERITTKVFSTLILGFILVLIPICFLAYNKDFGFHETWYRYFISYVGGLILFMIFLKFKWSNKLTDFGGRISYSLYLLHPIAGIDLAFILWKKGIIVTGPFSYIAFSIVVSIFSAMICFYMVEKPFVKIGRAFSKNEYKPVSL